ncbi:MAG: OmpH family outer membrane protein [Deltaproteobacteria bacterium]|jgi:outer membrane protein|nr:OmpH family outer membrane protein [Deltaproteobacteria bacterium]
MKSLLVRLVFVLLLGVFLTPVWSVEAAELKIAVVDIEKVVSSSKKGIQVQKELQADLKKSQAQIDTKKTSFEKLASNYEKQKASLSDTVRIQKEEELVKTQRELQRSVNDIQEELNKKRDLALADIYKNVIKVVEDIAGKENYSLVLNKKQAIFAGDAIDISDLVIKALDK